MALVSSHLLPFLLLSLTAASWGWRYEDQPYGQSETSNGYSQSAGSDSRYTPHAERPPPRINTDTGYGDMGTRPESDAWNRAERPQQSQFDYEESNKGFGNARTETLDCGKDLYISSNKIIDIQTSVQFGAQLLDGVYSYSFDSCVDACCSYEGCNLALYKMNGASETGKTCYFVHCGLQEHCRMVSNDGFKAGFLIQKPNYGDILDDHSAKQNPDESSSTTTEPPETPSSSPSATPTTQATPTEADVISTETTESPDSTIVPMPETHSKPNGTEKPATKEEETTPTTDTPTQSSSEGNISSPVATSNIPPSSSEPSTTDSTPQSSSGATNTSKVAIDNATRAQKKADNYDKCAKDGCDGSGLIAVSIIGTLIIIVLFVVAAVIGRRIYKLKTRRQYRNVDYLINGMYT